MDTGEGLTIIDIRDSHSFDQGHIPEAKHLKDDNVEVFLKTADKQKALLCYCYHGNSSRQAASFFAGQGFKEVYSMDGGWEEWRTVYG